MTKYRCDECDPSCELEIRGYNGNIPSGCPCNEPPTNWYVVPATRKSKSAKRRKPAAKKVEQDAAAKARSLLF